MNPPSFERGIDRYLQPYGIAAPECVIEREQPCRWSRRSVSEHDREQSLVLPGGVVAPVLVFRDSQIEEQCGTAIECLGPKRDFLKCPNQFAPHIAGYVLQLIGSKGAEHLLNQGNHSLRIDL